MEGYCDDFVPGARRENIGSNFFLHRYHSSFSIFPPAWISTVHPDSILQFYYSCFTSSSTYSKFSFLPRVREAYHFYYFFTGGSFSIYFISFLFLFFHDLKVLLIYSTEIF
ncbi:hypothetical protein BDZ91DRAFT_547585 [Kalaharituber pfeilii]|nr:hypothetical protein BDZ91DRAFT_547585 [Kalaharituber pfeilii]